ncbi:hypothetical protein [Nesterenkonia muleiensis]|uniref:variant leucine-rich repeat-containing protein n=1 Tax=Nesterenkonia muleiensis TaxID=2282648 RepID=UPI000E7725FF|nr:hypothetical protein [Nesterenkonia muleiensis]
MTQDPAAKAADPSTSHAELYELARSRPDLRPQIAGNPNTYPALLEWLGRLGDPSIDSVLSQRGPSEDATAVQPAPWQQTQAMPGQAPREQPTEEFGAVQRSHYEEPTSVQPPVRPRPDFDQQVYGAAAPYASAQPHYAPPAVYDPDDDEPPRKRKSGAGVLIFLLVLVTAAALAAAYFFLVGNPLADDEPDTDDQPDPVPTQEEDEEEDDPEEPAESPEPEESPSPTEEDEDDDDEPELESPVPDDALSITDFSSPTGNINCQLSEEDVVCTVLEHDFEAPSECGNGVTFRVGAQGQAEIDCSLSVGSQGQALEYGEVTGNESFACQAQELYFECWSQLTGNGFEIAREYYELRND